jgi:hypothetical protein
MVSSGQLIYMFRPSHQHRNLPSQSSTSSIPTVASAWRPQIGASIQILIFSSRLHNREAALITTPSHLLSHYPASTRIFSPFCDISYLYEWTRLGGCLQHRCRREIHRHSSLAVLRRAAKVEYIDNTIRKYMSVSFIGLLKSWISTSSILIWLICVSGDDKAKV